MSATQQDKAKRFLALHENERAFIIPNPWDAGSARMLEALGFEALATTSSGFAFTRGRVDGAVSLDETLTHCSTLCAATDVPVSVDLENGYGDDPAAAATAVTRAAEAGVVGGSIEDYSGNETRVIYDVALAAERIAAAVEAARSLPFPFTLTARAENLIRGRDDLGDTIRRLQAFEEAGADVLYAPGLVTLDQVRAVTSSVGKPVNVLGTMIANVTLKQLADAGARRVSIGGSLARAAMAPAYAAASEMAARGSFTWASQLASSPSLEAMFDPSTNFNEG